MKIQLLLKEITDFYVRSNFDSLQRYLKAENKLEGFKFIDTEVDSAVSHFSFPHGLGATPLDVIPTLVSDGATVTWHYDEFDQNNVVFTTSAGCRIRAFVGRYAP